MFFARKFDSAIDQSVINRLEEEQHGVDPISYPRWAGYWENVYHTSDTTPTSNRALLSVSSCIGQSVLSQANQSLFCELKRPRTVALTSYFHHDFYQGDLILYDVLLNGQIAQLEALVRPLNKTILSPESRLMSTLRVGSDYDPKEQTLRNRMGVLSQLSKPMAFYKWGNYPGAVVQFTWFDPELKVRAVHDVNISDTSKVNWKIILFFQNIVSLLSFLDRLAGTWSRRAPCHGGLDLIGCTGFHKTGVYRISHRATTRWS